MTQLSKKLEKLIRDSKELIPVKSKDGILVGDVLIVSNGPIKDLYQRNELVYKEVHLNTVAIKLANMLALRQTSVQADEIYRADQAYGKWFVDSQVLRTQYQNAAKKQEYERADMLWARYCESRDRTITAKDRAQRLAAT